MTAADLPKKLAQICHSPVIHTVESLVDAGVAAGPVADRQLNGKPASGACVTARQLEQVAQLCVRVVFGVFDLTDDVVDHRLLPGVEHPLPYRTALGDFPAEAPRGTAKGR